MTRSSRASSFLSVSLLLFILLVPSVLAQSTARIEGIVTDNTGSPLPGATVTALNVETNQSRVAVSGGDGSYTITPLAVGEYRVSVELSGFRPWATPVTLRKVSSGFIFATAHGANSEELKHWAALASVGLTLALYMGKSIAAPIAGKLIRNGIAPSVPVGIVVNAGRSDRSYYFGTMGELADGAVAFADGPAIIFVGAAVAAGDWQAAVPLAEAKFKVA